MEDLRRCYSDFFGCSVCDELTQECFFPEYKQDQICHTSFLNVIVSYKKFLKSKMPTVESFEAFTGWQRSPTFEKEWFQRRLNNLCINIR